jgi:prepilin-type processing-associated H-X9-DG protein
MNEARHKARENEQADELIETPDEQLATERFGTRHWSQAEGEAERISLRQRCADLPLSNQFLLGCGFLLLGALLAYRIAAPISDLSRAAIKPFTVEGQKETCLAHLQSIQQALALYREDHNDRLPLLDYGSRNKRVTWIKAIVEPDAAENGGNSGGSISGGGSFLCPLDSVPADQRDLVGSYGLNPVLAGATSPQSDAASVILLADRGKAHDVSLLPPFVSWPSTEKEGAKQSANIAFRHGGQAAVLYADGHADTAFAGDWLYQPASWGGPLLQKAALARLQQQNPVLTKMQAGRRLSATERRQLKRASSSLLSLWKASLQEDKAAGEPLPTEKLLWRAAYALSTAGDQSLERSLREALHGHSQALLQRIKGGAWSSHQAEAPVANGRLTSGFQVSLPPGWKVETEQEGRYRNTYLRSASPYIYVLIERGERSSPASGSTIDWSGMEEDFKRKYGRHYRQMGMGVDTLGGEDVSTWQFEVRKPDGPALRKLYVGHSFAWSSYVIVCTAPAKEYEDWQSTFQTVLNGFAFGSE